MANSDAVEDVALGALGGAVGSFFERKFTTLLGKILGSAVGHIPGWMAERVGTMAGGPPAVDMHDFLEGLSETGASIVERKAYIQRIAAKIPRSKQNVLIQYLVHKQGLKDEEKRDIKSIAKIIQMHMSMDDSEFMDLAKIGDIDKEPPTKQAISKLETELQTQLAPTIAWMQERINQKRKHPQWSRRILTGNLRGQK